MANFNTILLEQGSDDWFDWRNEGVTATNAVVLGARLKGVKLYPKESVYRIWAEKTGLMNPRDLSGDPNVRRGKELEDQARLAAESVFNDLLIPLCVESKFDPRIRASLDGITSDGYPVELKCPALTTWDALKKDGENAEVFKRYWIQVQHQLLTLGAMKGYLVFFVENQDLMIFTIDVDKSFLNHLYKLEVEFWEQVKTKTAPAKDLDNDHYIPEGEAAKDWIYNSEQFKSFEDRISDLKNQIEELEKAQKPFADALVQYLGDYKTGEFNGLQITQVRKRGSLDSEKLVERIKSLDSSFNEDEFRRKGTSYIRVTKTNDDMPRDLNDEEIRQLLEEKKVDYQSAIF